MKTLYDLLGVSRHATRHEIEQEYRRYLSRHISETAGRPPRKKEQRQLQMVRNAYLILCSPIRRDAYDRTLMLRDQRRGRLVELGGKIAAAVCMVAGVALILGSTYMRQVENNTESPPEITQHAAPANNGMLAVNEPIKTSQAATTSNER